jgi:YfiH family protein
MNTLSTPAGTLNPDLLTAPNGVRWFSAPSLQGLPWLIHGFSTRMGGVSAVYSTENDATELNLGFTPEDSADNVRENRRRLVEAVSGNAETPLLTVRQIHSNVTELVSVVRTAPSTTPCEADGLITSEAGCLLGILTADCIPVLVADPARRVVAAFHAGWRGTVQRIVELGIARMVSEFGSDPQDLLAAIGPGIGACCYRVGESLLTEFKAQFDYADELFSGGSGEPSIPEDPQSIHLDLVEANRRQLLAAGVKPESISVVGGCTSCQPQFFYSHRASRGHAGRMMSVIGAR